MDAADVAELEREYGRMNTSFTNLGVRTGITLYSKTYTSSNSLGEKAVSFVSSAISAKVWDYSSREILLSQGLLDDTYKKVITEDAITIDDEVDISGNRYVIVGVTQNVLGSTIWYIGQVRRLS